VLALTVQKLKAAPPAGLYANAEQILASRIDSSWFIAGGQLTVILEAGVIAPLSSGDVVVTFAEKDLQGLLSDYGKALL
jgi:hypothetical protein